MSEPENLVLLVLRELRQDNAELRRDLSVGFLHVNSRLDEMSKRIDSLAQAMRGESVLGRYAALEVDDRLDRLEKRLEALEGRS